MKKFISIVLTLTMLLTLTACGQKAPKSPVPERPIQSNVADVEESKYPLFVTDQAGRNVTIEKEPQRLISSYYITTSLIMALDLGDKLVGIENTPEKRPVYALSDPELLELPCIGTVKELDMEQCAALEPDLLILPMKLQHAVEILEELGMTVILVNPESQTLLEEMIDLVGTATNTEEEAQALLAYISAQKERLEETLEHVEKPSVYLAGNSDFLSTAGGAMYQSDLIRMAGGQNVAAEITDTYWAEVSYEQILSWDPEYIILASAAGYTAEDVLADPNLAGCRAIVNGNVYQIPDTAEAWDSPVPGSILGAVWLSGILHPEACPEEETLGLINEYYERFYDFTYQEN